uniref:Uncharacterized protein n=1 Tax=Glossina austeni TaxID=7395 RepID=A0A1A9UZL9_GLOAU
MNYHKTDIQTESLCSDKNFEFTGALHGDKSSRHKPLAYIVTATTAAFRQKKLSKIQKRIARDNTKGTILANKWTTASSSFGQEPLDGYASSFMNQFELGNDTKFSSPRYNTMTYQNYNLLWNAYVLCVGLALSLRCHRHTGLMFIKPIARPATMAIS